MEYTVERFDARQWSDEQMTEPFSEGFPPFITPDPVAHVHTKQVGQHFGNTYHIMLVDAEERPAAAVGESRFNGLDMPFKSVATAQGTMPEIWRWLPIFNSHTDSTT